MSSRLQKRIQSEIAAAASDEQRALWLVKLAAYEARLGNTKKASGILREVKELFGLRISAQLISWIFLAEGIVDFHRDPMPKSIDRIQRAYWMSRAIGERELRPLAAAWMAHMDLIRDRYTSMIDLAEEAYTTACGDDFASLSRVSLVVADAFNFAGDFSIARTWYSKVRNYALEIGDEVMISAMLHNIAALQVASARMRRAFGHLDEEHVRRALMNVETTGNFDAGIGLISLSSMVPLIRAQILSLCGEFSKALELFDENAEFVNSDSMRRLRSNVFCDRAWCNANLGRGAVAGREISSALDYLCESIESDDLAILHATVANTMELIGLRKGVTFHRELASRYWAEHTDTQKSLLQMLVNRTHGWEASRTAHLSIS